MSTYPKNYGKKINRRIRIRAEKYFKFSKLLNECYTADDLADMYDMPIRTVYKIASNPDIKPKKISRELNKAAIRRELNRYMRIRKLMRNYSARKTARILGIPNMSIYRRYEKVMKGETF